MPGGAPWLRYRYLARDRAAYFAFGSHSVRSACARSNSVARLNQFSASLLEFLSIGGPLSFRTIACTAARSHDTLSDRLA